MKRPAIAACIALAATCLLAATGCGPRSTYRVESAGHEVVADKLDAEWFTREIYDHDGVSTVELVYCPMMPGQPLVCRSARVWQRNVSQLLTRQP